MEELKVLNFDMFTTLMLAVLAIYFGDFLRKVFPVLKKYCLPASVVGGTIFALISLLLFKMGVVELKFDEYAEAINKLFYCIFFAASGAAASMALLKKGGKLVVIFAVLAAVLAALQNGVALAVGKFMNIDPLISMMTGSIPMTGGHGNAASFAPIAVKAGAVAAKEVAIAAATFGLISGCMLGGPFGNFLVKRFKLDEKSTEKEVMNEIDVEGESGNLLVDKPNIIQAVFLMCIAIGIGKIIELCLKFVQESTGWKVALPIHVCCMFAGIIMRLIYDRKNGNHDVLYESIDIVGEFSLALFVSMSIITMKLWQLSGLGMALVVLLIAQVVLIVIFCYFLTFKLLGKNYDAAVMAVGHMGFGLGAVPVSMTTMQAVCKKYRYSKLAFFVVPVIGGFISNLTNAMIITKFLDFAKDLHAVWIG
ncbi:sodium/glutamate symporter [Fusobacterium pseudoperiodonticum]|uniref:sodium/glutamate symporter n=1 Tax=Fusobacterium pseudoperiodonticum TaxID=2663009 RepID=UPI000C1BC087|nr:sodium/glutamate symporter [Fusobacterium pseudoperiodonticum]ATV58035.1 sodium:glutamate symporter [Fusobacterium pseudoperiodonticum]ATV67346.1 sodium:glutamate symporter [Fusobacterium pseudoperiodonticum]